jgi:hypothetical protein
MRFDLQPEFSAASTKSTNGCRDRSPCCHSKWESLLHTDVNSFPLHYTRSRERLRPRDPGYNGCHPCQQVGGRWTTSFLCSATCNASPRRENAAAARRGENVQRTKYAVLVRGIVLNPRSLFLSTVVETSQRIDQSSRRGAYIGKPPACKLHKLL